MAKVIIDSFDGGLAIKNRNIPSNQFSVGEKVDILSDPGYLKPSLAISSVQTTAGIVLRGIPANGVVDSTNGKAYIISLNGDLYQMTLATDAFNADFDGAGHYYKAITNFATWLGAGFTPSDLIIYNISGTANLFYSYNTAAKGYVGSYPLTAAVFTDDKLDLGATAKESPHPMIEWNSYLWIANGQYLAKYVGSTDTLTATDLDLGNGWEITALFSTNNYLGICAWKKGVITNQTESRVFYWDGTSDNYIYTTPVKDSRIFGAVNHNGNIVLGTYGNNGTVSVIRRLTDSGSVTIRKLRYVVNGSDVDQRMPSFCGITISRNKILMGCCNTDNYGVTIVALGDEESEYSETFTYPYLLSTTAPNYLIFIKQFTNTKIYVGWRDTGAVGTLSSIDLAGTTYGTATYKAGYTDFGQKVRINYIKLYFKPLVASDSITVGIDTDYGTANTIGNITFTLHGGITEKKLYCGKTIRCHAFRPTIVWNAGGVAISKIVVDYDFIAD